jgi:5'-nucleotidase / UDP-sugar diphosphatase
MCFRKGPSTAAQQNRFRQQGYSATAQSADRDAFAYNTFHKHDQSNIRNNMRHLFTLLVTMLILLLAGCSAGHAHRPLSVEIIHVNDVHSHLDEEPLDLTLGGKATRVKSGGYPRIAAMAKTYAAQNENVLLLNAGDALQGTLYYTLFGGDADAALMNTVAWDAFVLGNHEFDDGDAALAHFLGQVNVPVVAANVVPTGDDPLAGDWRPYVIKRFKEEPVGIIGVDIAGATEASSRPGKAIRFADEITSVQRYVDVLETMGINKIILLSHFGYENDLNLSKQVSGVDVIIDGHSHTLMGEFAGIGLHPQAPYPVRSVSRSGEPVCIAQAWAYAKVIGRLEVAFDQKGVVTACSGTPVLMVDDRFSRREAGGGYTEVNASERAAILAQIADDPMIEVVAPDPRAQDVLETYKAEVDKKKQEVIGYAETELRHIRVPGRDYLGNDGAELPLGSETAPVVAKAFCDRVADADLCILNAGSVRTNLEAGPISTDTAYTLLPFSDTLYTIVMKGSEIRKVLEDALSYCDGGGSGGSFPYAYGIRYGIDMKAPAGHRIQKLQIRDRKSGIWSAIGERKRYNVVTLDYLADGKDGYATFKRVQELRGKGTDTYLDYAMSFVDYVKRLRAAGKPVGKLPAAEGCIQNYRQ